MAIKTKLEDMEIGDMIACRYKAGGYFSELGTCVAPELPLAGSANPDGLFYFRKVDTGLLIADRVVQLSISWDTLNGLGLIQGKIVDLGNSAIHFEPTLTEASPLVTTRPDIPIYAQQAPWRVFDKTTNHYDVNSNLNGWLQVDLEKTCNINRIIHRICGVAYNINTDSLQYYGSLNNIDWFPLGKAKGTLATSDVVYDFPCVDVRYVKAIFAGQMWIAEIEILKVPITSNVLIRSLSGGNSYLDENGKSSLTDKGLGTFPSNNEWDKYVVKSNLNRTITAGDDSVWNWSKCITQCQDTPINGFVQLAGAIGTSNDRIMRSYTQQTNSTLVTPWIGTSSYVNSLLGFRPILEYIEPKSKATTLFY